MVARSAIALVPSNTNATRAPSWNYGSPFNVNAPGGNVPSKLSADLGSNAVADAGTPIFNACAGLDGVQSGLNQVVGGAASLQSTISGGAFNTSLDQAKTAIGKVANILEGGDKKFY